MTVLNAVLGTITFLAITVVFTVLTWWIFKLALSEKNLIKQKDKKTIIISANLEE